MEGAYEVGSDLNDEVSVVCMLILIENEERTKQIRPRSCWVRPWLSRRLQFGAYHSLMDELKKQDTKALKNFLRMDWASFQELLGLVDPLIRRNDTNMRECITSGERLALTLRFLATGDSYQSLEFLYRVSKNTISKIIPETCKAIYDVLQSQYLTVPETKEQWADVAQRFSDRWNFPNCIGALDGKHIALRKPRHTGSEFYNYKGFCSIVILALVDADYKFVYVDIGTNGRMGDAGIFANSPLSLALDDNSLKLPQPQPLPDRHLPVPCVIVGDEAFPLKCNLMKPFPSRGLTVEKRIFNYRLSRARRISENAFGIISSRFGVLQKAMVLEPGKAEHVVQAIVALHNFLRCKSDKMYICQGSGNEDAEIDHEIVMTPFTQQGGNKNPADARNISDEYCDYFNTNGQVDWQWNNV